LEWRKQTLKEADSDQKAVRAAKSRSR